MARLGRGRRSGARITQARPTPTATPLVRKRLVQTPNSVARATVRAYRFNRRHARIIIRAVVAPFVAQKPKQPVQSPNARLRAVRVRAYNRRARAHIIIRSILQPVIPKRPVVTQNGNDRAHHVRYYNRRRARIITAAPRLAAPPVQPAKKPILGRGRLRPALRRALSNRGASQAFRAPSTPTATPLVRRHLVQTPNGSERAARVRFFNLRRHAHIVVRPPVAPAVAYRRPTVIVTSNTRRAARVKFTQRHHTRLVVGRPSISTAPRQKQPIVRRNPKAAAVRYHVRHRAHFETSTLGSSAPTVIIVVGQFDSPTPAGGMDAGTPTGLLYDGGTPAGGVDPGTPAGPGYDAPTPGQVLV